MYFVLLLPHSMEIALKSDYYVRLALKCSSFLISPTGILLLSPICCINSDHSGLKCSNSTVVCFGLYTAYVAVEVTFPSHEVWNRTPEDADQAQAEGPTRICWPGNLSRIYTHWPLPQHSTAGWNSPQDFRNSSQENFMKVWTSQKMKMKLM